MQSAARSRRRLLQLCGRLARQLEQAESQSAGLGRGLQPSSRSAQRGYSAGAQPASSRGSRGPVSYLSLGLTLGTGAAMLWWFDHEKAKKMEVLAARDAVVVGSAKMGGPFELVDAQGRQFTDADLLGAFSLLYFGFTYCPDVCPEELEKVAAATDLVEKASGARLRPVFVTVDPERDGVQQVREYVREFHPRLVGLTGTPAQVREAARAYRVYYSRTASGDDDYLVDHSIITYLLAPDGSFLTFFGKNYTAEEMAAGVATHMAAWHKQHPDWKAKA